MKKILFMFASLFIFSALLASNSNAVTIRELLNAATPSNTIAVVGDLSSDMDAYFVMNRIIFDNKLEAYGQDDPGIANVINTKNIIMIGGPCVNTKYWNTFSGETCNGWQYKQGQALVKAIKKGNQNILLISGTDREDTFDVVDQISNAIGTPWFHQEILVYNSSRTVIPYTPKCQTTTDYCQTLTIDCEAPLRFGNTDFTAELKSIRYDKGRITILIDGTAHQINRGEKINVKGLELTYDNVDYDFATGKPTKAILSSSQKVDWPKGYGIFSTPNDKGTFESAVLKEIHYLRFPLHNGEAIKFYITEIDPAGTSIKVEIDDKLQVMRLNDVLTVNGVNIILKDIDYGTLRASFEYNR